MQTKCISKMNVVSIRGVAHSFFLEDFVSLYQTGDYSTQYVWTIISVKNGGLMLRRSTFMLFLILLTSVLAWPQTNEKSAGILVIDSAKVAASDFTNQSLKFMVTAAETDGRMTVFESVEHPGFKTQWHSHNNSEETFYVLEGTLT